MKKESLELVKDFYNKKLEEATKEEYDKIKQGTPLFEVFKIKEVRR